MQGLGGSQSNITLLSEQCLVSTGKFLPVVSPEESSFVRVFCHNPAGENIVTCRDDRNSKFLDEVGGLSLDTPLESDVYLFDSYIPIFDFRTISQALQVNSSIVGLNLSSILRSALKEKAGIYVPQRIVFRDVSDIAKLCRQKKVILFLSGPDTLIESVWYNRDYCDLFTQLQRMNFWAVTGFNFSVFGGECPFAHALNQKRSLYSSVLVRQHGLRSIPHVYAVNKYHMARYQKWLSENPEVRLITMNCQLQRSEQDISQVVLAVSEFLAKNPRLHVLLQGFCLNEANRFGSLLERIHFADAKPVKYGQNFRKLELLSSEVIDGVCNDIRNYERLVIHNVEARRREVDGIKREFSKISKAS